MKNIFFLIFFLQLINSTHVSSEEYYYHHFNEKIYLTKIQDEFAVLFKENVSEDVKENLIISTGSKIISLNDKKGGTV